MRGYQYIRNEVGNAVDFVRGHAASELPDLLYESAAKDIEVYPALRDQPDDAPVPNFAVELPDLGPSTILAIDEEEFRLIYRALGEIHGPKVSYRAMADDVDHLRAHLGIVYHLGFRVMRYGLAVRSSTRKSYSWEPFYLFAKPKRPITKLELGAIAAAPYNQQAGDRRRLRELGYKNVTEVAKRVWRSDYEVGSMPLPEGFPRLSRFPFRHWLS